MKKIIASLSLFASLAILVVSVSAQTPAPAQTPAAKGACSEEAKTATYTEFTTHRTTDVAKAYEAGKKYLACSQGEDQYTAYLKKWVAAYEKEARKTKMVPMLYGEKKYAEALGLGKEILADEPENLRVLIDLGYGSYLAAVNLKQVSFNNDALTYSRKSIQMIESGKAPATWAPFKGKDDTLAFLHDVVGQLTLKDNPSSALTSFIKKAQFETDLKKDPWTYYFIAAAYENGPYAKLSADYKTRFEGKDESPESKLALENINQVIDRMVDAYARAVALAGNDPKYATPKKEWMEGLSTWYKYRHNQSDTGLTELIASVLSKPLPPEPTPVTTLPASPTSTTPTTGGSNAAGSASAIGVTTAATPSATPVATPTATTGAAPSTATPPKTTTPAKPKPRNNHRRRT
ncbi:MAG: hypothetical protein M3539_01805 [Acidobacteriota bacterium]|nr:hypothetical protein [Acidobacteriota bacterium]